MEQGSNKIEIYLEIGKKRTFAGAIEWQGWCRSGRDDHAAMQVLCDYGPRYAVALRPAHLGFQPPTEVSAFVVIERLPGDATTDFGAPGKPPSSDSRPVDEIELRRFQELLKTCWQTFDAAVNQAIRKELRKGPRGGGRSLEGIIQHVQEAEAAYLARLGGQLKKGEDDDLDHLRQVILETLASSAHGELPAAGPRGGIHWTLRYFVRRAAWHVLDHAWEIENRLS